MENSNVRIVEINGVKMEVDLRNVKVIENYKVGDNVKVLRKNGTDYNIYPGVIIDFVDFEVLPTIQIAIFNISYWGNTLEFINFNSSSKDIEISKVSEHELSMEKNRVIDKLDQEINKARATMEEIQNKKDYLINHFGKYFHETI